MSDQEKRPRPNSTDSETGLLDYSDEVKALLKELFDGHEAIRRTIDIRIDKLKYDRTRSINAKVN